MQAKYQRVLAAVLTYITRIWFMIPWIGSVCVCVFVCECVCVCVRLCIHCSVQVLQYRFFE